LVIAVRWREAGELVKLLRDRIVHSRPDGGITLTGYDLTPHHRMAGGKVCSLGLADRAAHQQPPAAETLQALAKAARRAIQPLIASWSPAHKSMQ
jgi:hypothetical protein